MAKTEPVAPVTPMTSRRGRGLGVAVLYVRPGTWRTVDRLGMKRDIVMVYKGGGYEY